MDDRSPLGQEELIGSLRLAATAHHEQARDATGHLLTEAADEIERLRQKLDEAEDDKREAYSDGWSDGQRDADER